MFRSLHMKLVLIMLLLITSLMAIGCRSGPQPCPVRRRCRCGR